MKLLKTRVHIHLPLCVIPAVHLLPLLASVTHTVYLCLQPSQPELTAHSSQPSKDVVQTRCCLRYAGAADSVVVASGCWSTGDRPGVSHFWFPSLCCSFRLRASQPSLPSSPASTDAAAYRPTCRCIQKSSVGKVQK